MKKHNMYSCIFCGKVVLKGDDEEWVVVKDVRSKKKKIICLPPTKLYFHHTCWETNMLRSRREYDRAKRTSK